MTVTTFPARPEQHEAMHQNPQPSWPDRYSIPLTERLAARWRCFWRRFTRRTTHA